MIIETVIVDKPNRILRLPDVIVRSGLSRSTIYRKMAEGTFPAQIRSSSHSSGWRETEVDRWFADPVNYRALD